MSEITIDAVVTDSALYTGLNQLIMFKITIDAVVITLGLYVTKVTDKAGLSWLQETNKIT